MTRREAIRILKAWVAEADHAHWQIVSRVARDTILFGQAHMPFSSDEPIFRAIRMQKMLRVLEGDS